MTHTPHKDTNSAAIEQQADSNNIGARVHQRSACLTNDGNVQVVRTDAEWATRSVSELRESTRQR